MAGATRAHGVRFGTSCPGALSSFSRCSEWCSPSRWSADGATLRRPQQPPRVGSASAWCSTSAVAATRASTTLSWAGLARAERELDVTRVPRADGAEDREAALRLFAARGFDLVIGVGFIFSSDIDEVARAYPGTRFACVDYAPPFVPAWRSRPTSPASRSARKRARSSSARSRGSCRRTQHVGFVGGMDMPLIHKFEAGYRAGVEAVCPTCVVHVAYAGTTPDAFRDPAKGKALATAQIAAGATSSITRAGSTGHGVFEAARERRRARDRRRRRSVRRDAGARCSPR